MLIRSINEKTRADFFEAMGVENENGSPSWPLPNLKLSSEKSFWGWRATYEWRGEAWLGQTKVGGEYATVIVYYVGHSNFIDGGFAVAVFRRYQQERVEYFEWRACEHEFQGKTIGNCLHLYTCSKCGKAYEVDSSG